MTPPYLRFLKGLSLGRMHGMSRNGGGFPELAIVATLAAIGSGSFMRFGIPASCIQVINVVFAAQIVF